MAHWIWAAFLGPGWQVGCGQRPAKHWKPGVCVQHMLLHMARFAWDTGSPKQREKSGWAGSWGQITEQPWFSGLMFAKACATDNSRFRIVIAGTERGVM